MVCPRPARRPLTVDSQFPGVLQGPVADLGVLGAAGQHPLVVPVPRGQGQHRPGDVAHLVADVGRRPDEAVPQPPGDNRVRPDNGHVVTIVTLISQSPTWTRRPRTPLCTPCRQRAAPRCW